MTEPNKANSYSPSIASCHDQVLLQLAPSLVPVMLAYLGPEAIGRVQRDSSRVRGSTSTVSISSPREENPLEPPLLPEAHACPSTLRLSHRSLSSKDTGPTPDTHVAPLCPPNEVTGVSQSPKQHARLPPLNKVSSTSIHPEGALNLGSSHQTHADQGPAGKGWEEGGTQCRDQLAGGEVERTHEAGTKLV
jgi:hypothetical protein